MMKRRLSPAWISVFVLYGFAAQHANAAPPTCAEAFRFLNQATFDPTSAEIARLIALGDSSQAYASWIDEQMAIAPSLHLPVIQAKYALLNFAPTNLGFLNA
jgi:hypothetical protein